MAENIETTERPKVLSFRGSEEEYEALTFIARVRGMSLAEYLRDRLQMGAVVEDANRIREVARTG